MPRHLVLVVGVMYEKRPKPYGVCEAVNDCGTQAGCENPLYTVKLRPGRYHTRARSHEG